MKRLFLLIVLIFGLALTMSKSQANGALYTRNQIYAYVDANGVHYVDTTGVHYVDTGGLYYIDTININVELNTEVLKYELRQWKNEITRRSISTDSLVMILKKLSKQYGYTSKLDYVSYLSQKLNISVGQINRFIRGKYKKWRKQSIAKYASLLTLSLLLIIVLLSLRSNYLLRSPGISFTIIIAYIAFLILGAYSTVELVQRLNVDFQTFKFDYLIRMLQ